MQQQANNFKALQTLHGAMLAGMAMLAATVTFLIISHGAFARDTSFEKTLQVVVVLVSVGGTTSGFMLFKKKLQAIPPEDPARAKLAAYRAAAILRWALIEGPAIFALISFLLTGNYAFLALGIALMLVFVVVRPAKPVIVYLLQLNQKEISELDGVSE